MKLVLHIGPPKTGSSAIQIALRQNRTALLEAGILSFFDPKDTARALTTAYLPPKDHMFPALRRKFWSMEQVMAWSNRAWDRLEAEIDAHKPHTVILSSEHFASPELMFEDVTERLVQLSDDIHVIAYTRDPASLYCSFIDQQIRGGVRLAQLKTPWNYEYPPVTRLKRFYDRYGPDRMHVQSFDRKRLKNGDVVADFMDKLDNELSLSLPEIAPGEEQNASIAGAATALLLVMNETFVRNRKTGQDKNLLEHRAQFLMRLRRSEALSRMPRLALPDDDLKQMIRYNSRETLDWFNNAFFNGEPVMNIGAPGGDIPPQSEQHEFMKNWLLGYLDNEGAQHAAREVIG